MLWIGERTRQPDGAHVEFFSGVHNPLGVKLGPDGDAGGGRSSSASGSNPGAHARPADADRADRRRAASRELLPPLLRAVREAEHPVVWACDPMHANVFTTASAARRAASTRSWARSRGSSPPAARRASGPAACTSSSRATTSPSASAAREAVLEEQLDARYETLCDPRLNARQSLDLAFRVAELMRAGSDPRRSTRARDRRHRADRRLGRARREARRGVARARLGPRPGALAAAAERGAVDAPPDRSRRRSRGADLAVVAAPVAQLPAEVAAVLAASADGLHRHRRRLDEGGGRARPRAARRASSAAIRSAAPRRAAPEHATAELFDGATWFLTPIADDRPDALPARPRLRRRRSARCRSRSTPDAHDRLVALTSHLPHVLANVLVNQAGASARSRATSRSRARAARCAT